LPEVLAENAPEVLAAAAPEDDEEALADAPECIGNEAILLGSTFHDEWKCSYAQPKPVLAKYLKGVERLETLMTPCLRVLSEPRNQPTLEVRLARAERNAANRKRSLANVPKNLK
jgi:hypothetical protein